MINYFPSKTIPMSENPEYFIFQVRDAVLNNPDNLNLADNPICLYDSLYNTVLEDLPNPILWYLIISEKNDSSIRYNLSFCFGKVTASLLYDFVENTKDYRRTDGDNKHIPVVVAEDISSVLPEIIKLNKKEGLIALSMELISIQDLRSLRFTRFPSRYTAW